MYRILVTGSRAWPWPNTVNEALRSEISIHYKTHTDFVLIHGACPFGGADEYADYTWRQFQKMNLGVTIHPAEQYPMSRFIGAKARNQAMVDTNPNVVLSFAEKWASGTGMTARMARKAGIRVRDFGVDTK